MKKVYKFFILLLCFTILAIIVQGCSTSPVGKTGNVQDLELVRLNLKIQKYEDSSALTTIPFALKIYTQSLGSSEKVLEKTLNFDGTGDIQWIYEHDITSYYNIKKAVFYEVVTAGTGYMNSKKEIEHEVEIHAEGFVTTYAITLNLYKLSEHTHIADGSDTTLPLPTENGNEIKITFPDDAIPEGGLDIRITPINVLASSVEQKFEGNIISTSENYIHCQVGSTSGGVFTPLDSYTFNSDITISFPVASGLTRSASRGTVAFAVYDEENQKWVKDETGSNNVQFINEPGTENDRIVGNINHFSNIMPILETEITYTVSEELTEQPNILGNPYPLKNCANSTSVSGTKTYTLGIGAASNDPSNPAPAVVLQYLGLTERHDEDINMDYFVDRYEWKKYFVIRHKKVYDVTYTDLDGITQNYIITDYINYTFESARYECHDQGSGQ